MLFKTTEPPSSRSVEIAKSSPRLMDRFLPHNLRVWAGLLAAGSIGGSCDRVT